MALFTYSTTTCETTRFIVFPSGLVLQQNKSNLSLSTMQFYNTKEMLIAIQQHSVQDFPATMKEDTLKGSWTPAIRQWSHRKFKHTLHTRYITQDEVIYSIT